MSRRVIAAAGAAALLITGCAASSSSHSAAARSAAASLTANPTYQADKAQLEAALLANFKKDYNPAHPVTSMMSAVRATFPHGDTQAIVNHAVQTFTLADAHGAERQDWIASIVTFALNQGTLPSGSANIPGVTAQIPTPPAVITSS